MGRVLKRKGAGCYRCAQNDDIHHLRRTRVQFTHSFFFANVMTRRRRLLAVENSQFRDLWALCSCLELPEKILEANFQTSHFRSLASVQCCAGILLVVRTPRPPPLFHFIVTVKKLMQCRMLLRPPPTTPHHDALPMHEMKKTLSCVFMHVHELKKNHLCQTLVLE